jgi:hypothetical protein
VGRFVSCGENDVLQMHLRSIWGWKHQITTEKNYCTFAGGVSSIKQPEHLPYNLHGKLNTNSLKLFN